MNNLFVKIKESYKKINKFFIINPHKHWIIFLRAFSIIIIALIIFSFYLFLQIKSEKVYEVIPVLPNKTSVLKEKLLKEVIDSFNKKAETYNTILKSQ